MNVGVLSPSDLSRLGGLELIARAIVEGAVSGGHRSPFHGYSAEFSQYRDYRPGDDLKYVDWKLFARTDRFFTKQFRETTNASAVIALDTSASMTFGGPVTKARYAQMFAAAIAFVVSRRGDAAGLLTFADAPGIALPPVAGRRHMARVLAALESASFGGGTDIVRGLRRAHELLPSRGLLMVISDLYELGDEALRELRRAVRGGHDVSVFHVVAREEIDPRIPDDVDLEDLENGDVRPMSASAVRAYRERFAEFVEGTRSRLLRDGIDYSRVETSVPIAAVLRRYLLKRAA